MSGWYFLTLSVPFAVSAASALLLSHDRLTWLSREKVLAWVWSGFLMFGVPTLGPAQNDDVTAHDALIVVHGASKVVYKKLGPFFQVYYEVNTPYPAQAVLDELRGQLAKRGWRPLKEDFLNPGLPSSHVTGWQSFGDSTTNPPTFVQQWLADWENSKGDVVVYGLRYRHKDRTTQDSDTLQVFGSYSSRSVADKQRDAAKSSKP